MKLSKDKKKQILLDSFDALKDDYENNDTKLKELIAMCFSVDGNMAIEMWEYIIKNNWKCVEDSNSAYTITDGLGYEVENQIGVEQLSNFIYDSSIIKTAMFNKSADLSYQARGIIIYFINAKKYDKANELIELASTNKSSIFANFLEMIIDRMADNNDNQVNSNVYSLLSHWTDQINDKQLRARINFSLLKLSERC